MNESHKAPLHYVGIGASAGGLEAIETFIRHMSPKSGLAFVIVQHLSPDYKSLMSELLAKHTDMLVHSVEDGQIVEANHIYLIPPKKNLRIFHGKLLLSEQDHNRGLNLPIDIFLRSLAEDQGEKAIGIVLSGTGSDGTRGIRAIKESGGMVMVQSEASARFDGMPRSAIATGLADFILAPEDMPKQLLAFIKYPHVGKKQLADNLLSDEDNTTRIFALLREKWKVDFTHYKPSTIQRRLERRMTVNQLHDLRDYVRLLERSSQELDTFYRELLIGVTNFFRDPEAFQHLADTIIPQVLTHGRRREARFWVAGCSTGEEAYSLAILCQEYINRAEHAIDLKIFATDVDKKAIEHASAGIYLESIAGDVPMEYLSKYFVPQDDHFVVARSIREKVVFAQHDITRDPPFTNIDFVSCRNLLIYLQPVLQRKVLELFNFSLTSEGILFLGSSETTGEMSDYFKSIHPKWKIYCCKGKSKAPTLHAVDTGTFEHRRLMRPRALTPAARLEFEEERVLDRFAQCFADEFVLFGAVINQDLELLHVIGDTQSFLSVPVGMATNDISKMILKELSIPLSTGTRRVIDKGKSVNYSNIRISYQGKECLVRMLIKRLPTRQGQDPLISLFVSEQTLVTPKEASKDMLDYDLGKEAQQRIADLEQELQFSRENLQATVEELETSNEELQATNEELLASNEELQSTNEELQSVNEELHTLNAEYQLKIAELTEANNDLDNLFVSTEIGTVFLDELLVIRRFTPKATELFNLIGSDVGRPFTHISHRFHDEANIDQLIGLVRDRYEPQEQEIFGENEHWYLLRLLPYQVASGMYSGVIITFIDITRLKNTQLELMEQRQRLEKYRRLAAMVRGANDAVTVQDTTGNVVAWNAEAERRYGWSEEEALNMNIRDLVPVSYHRELVAVLQRLKRGESMRSFLATRRTKNGQELSVCVNASLVKDDSGDSYIVTIERNTDEPKIMSSAAKIVRTFNELSRRQEEGDR
jgi:two-component system CheB/CheR fusion protein